jgi:hypothetical protein
MERGRPELNAQICALKAQPEAAELMNVSRRAVQHASAVQRDGVPELVEAVDGRQAGKPRSGEARIKCLN